MYLHTKVRSSRNSICFLCSKRKSKAGKERGREGGFQGERSLGCAGNWGLKEYYASVEDCMPRSKMEYNLFCLHTLL